MRNQIIFAFIAFLLAFFPTQTFSQQEAKLLRFPAIHGDQVVFSYAGDLYIVSSTGGIARKLTTDEGYEIFPRFSPDGKSIAFTGQYDGNTEVYLIPASGGIPKRLTHTATLSRDDISDRMGPNNIVMTWARDGNKVIYRSRKQSFNSFKGQLFKVSKDGGLSEELPLPSGGFCSYSPDGKQLAYNRVFREFRTWKYYRGGMADDVWIYNFQTKKTINITDNPAQDIIPMWHGDEIFFISDRDRIMNLFTYNTNTKETTKLTDFETYDIKFPSLGNNGIIFENGGLLYVFDFNTRRAEKINIQIADDFLTSRNELKDASKFINSVGIAPDGNRLVIGARGDIFTVPGKEGITRNLTQTPGAHDRNASWSPDGKWIAYISDVSGEYELYIINPDGKEKPIQLTKNTGTYIFSIEWSPDSKKILYNDKLLQLQYVDIETKKVTLVDRSTVGEITNFNWSPDSKWVTFSRFEKNRLARIYLHDISTGKNHPVTDEWYYSTAPTFSTNGKYLFFISKRDFNPIYSETEWNHAYRNMSKVYFATLAKETPNPLAPQNDEVKITAETPAEEKEAKAVNKEDKTITKVDIEGLGDRIMALPVKASNYWNIYATGDKVYYNESFFGGNGSTLNIFDLKEKKQTELGKGMSYAVSANGKKMLIKKNGSYYLMNLPSAKINLKDPVDLSNMKIMVNLKDEWKQIFDESWRQMRDFFYVENMHGVDWNAMHDKYAALLLYVNHRNDLNYIIGEMIGELSAGHAYVGGGDRPKIKKINIGLLGAKISKHSSGYFRIDKILKGQNWDKGMRSPLSEMGVGISEGNYIIAVSGKSAKKYQDLYEALLNTAGKQVELTVNTSPEEKGAQNVIVVPIADESNLYYYNWVQRNIETVNKATDGQVGYIHVPDMSAKGLNEFIKYFYPQLNKKALIIDDRGNGGGNVSPMLIERLSREVTRANMARNVTEVYQTPRQIMIGPKVLLVDRYSASDGDLFPYAFKKHNLGKVIGMRTWGGVVGIRGSLPFIDGGNLRKPEFASFSSEESEWIIEGYGVDPDIVIDNDPAREYEGIDDQLNKAIEVILEELKNYKELPPIPPAPDKSK